MRFACRRASRLVAAGVLLAAAPCCGRIGVELVPMGDGDRRGGALGGSGGASSSAGGSSPSGGGAPAGGTPGSGSSGLGGAAPDHDAAPDTPPEASTPLDASGADGGRDAASDAAAEASSPVACLAGAPAVKTWSFDSTTESWTFQPSAGVGALAWTGAVGNPSAGALSLDTQSGDGLLGWLVYYPPTTDLRGQIASAWVYLDADAPLGVKLFVQTTPAVYAWADGGFVSLSPRTWTCLSLDLDAPAYQAADYDPSLVLRFGIEMAGTAPLRVYADQFTY